MASSGIVLAYSKANLINQLHSISKSDINLLNDPKSHVVYFDGYLLAIGAKTIIVEDEYIDKDYLEDYAYYYVRSFADYKKTCGRLHFFKTSIDLGEFSKFLQGKPSTLNCDFLQEHYLGFMVVKPLPKTIIGKTCLTPYPHIDRRYYQIKRRYDVNLFGINLFVESLAYQEQDGVVAACASIAIWSSFHGTGHIFQHSTPSPVEITKNATKYYPYASRHFPESHGLGPEQIAEAIRRVGLEPFLVDGRTTEIIKSALYAYLKCKIPIIFGIQLYRPLPSGKYALDGGHAVTITGYSLGLTKASRFSSAGLLLTSSKIDKIYVHDDQVGAFAKMEFDNVVIKNRKNKKLSNTLTTSFPDSAGKRDVIRAEPEILIAPLYHKIRIPFKSILLIIATFDRMLTIVARYNKKPEPVIEWDIFLSTNTKFRQDLVEKNLIKGSKREQILRKLLPKYIWRAIGRINNKETFEIVFDATDIEQGKKVLLFIDYDPKFTKPVFEPILSNLPAAAKNHPDYKPLWEMVISEIN